MTRQSAWLVATFLAISASCGSCLGEILVTGNVGPNKSVVFVDAETGDLVSSFPLNSNPSVFAADATTELTFYTSGSAGQGERIGSQFFDGASNNSGGFPPLNSDPAAMSFDHANRQLLFSNHNDDKIERVDVDGMNRSDLVLAAGLPNAMDVAEGYVYWADTAKVEIRRAEITLGISIHETILSGIGASAIAADPTNEVVYYIVNSPGQLRKVGFDGTSDSYVADAITTGGMVLSPSRMLYWTSPTGLFRADIDSATVAPEAFGPPFDVLAGGLRSCRTTLSKSQNLNRICCLRSSSVRPWRLHGLAIVLSLLQDLRRVGSCRSAGQLVGHVEIPLRGRIVLVPHQTLQDVAYERFAVQVADVEEAVAGAVLTPDGRFLAVLVSDAGSVLSPSRLAVEPPAVALRYNQELWMGG